MIILGREPKHTTVCLCEREMPDTRFIFSNNPSKKPEEVIWSSLINLQAAHHWNYALLEVPGFTIPQANKYSHTLIRDNKLVHASSK